MGASPYSFHFFGWIYDEGGNVVCIPPYWVGRGPFSARSSPEPFSPILPRPTTACHVLCVLCRGRIRGVFVFPRLPLHFYGVESLLQGACSPQCQPCPSLSGERIPFFPSPNLWERLLLCISYGEVGLDLAGRALFSVTSSPLSPCLYLSSHFTPKLLSAQPYMGSCAHFLHSQALLSC